MYRAKYRAGPAGPSKVLSLKNGQETPCTSSVPDSPGGRYYGVPFYPRIRKWRIIPLKAPFLCIAAFRKSTNPSLIPDTSPKKIQAPLSASHQLMQPSAALKGLDKRERHAPMTAANGRSRNPLSLDHRKGGQCERPRPPAARAASLTGW